MPRPPRSPHTAETRQRALAALYASGDDVDGEWVPNATAVSRVVGMPTTATLLKWWRDRDKTQDSTHLKAAQRAREEARQQGAEAFVRDVVSRLQEGVQFVLEPQHRLTVGPGVEKLGLHCYARALREVVQVVERLKPLLEPPVSSNGQPEELSDAELARRLRAHLEASSVPDLSDEEE